MKTPNKSKLLFRLGRDVVVLEQQIASMKILLIDLQQQDISKNQRRLMITEIKKIVASVCKVGSASILSKKIRTDDISWARHLAMHFCTVYELGSSKLIAKHFGPRDRSIINHANKAVKHCLEIPDGIRIRQYRDCRERLEVRFWKLA